MTKHADNPLRELTLFQFTIFGLVDMYLPFLVRLLWPYLAHVSDKDKLEETNRRLDELRG